MIDVLYHTKEEHIKIITAKFHHRVMLQTAFTVIEANSSFFKENFVWPLIYSAHASTIVGAGATNFGLLEERYFKHLRAKNSLGSNSAELKRCDFKAKQENALHHGRKGPNSTSFSPHWICNENTEMGSPEYAERSSLSKRHH